MDITTKNLSKIYRSGLFREQVVALDDVSLTVESGMFGLLGPNGAGKTTLMRILATLICPTSGKAFVGDWAVNDNKDKWSIRSRLGYLPQEIQMYESLTAYEFLSFVTTVKQIPAQDRVRQIESVLELTGLTSFKKRKIKTFSGGMKRRIGIAQALVGDPTVLIVDEPTVGLDPQERVRFRNLLVRLSHNRLVLLSSHITEDIAHTCSHLAILNQGRSRFQGSTQSLLKETEGYVWEFTVPDAPMQEQKGLHVVSSVQAEDGIRYRVLAKKKPMESATPSSPTVEDAYLWLLHF